MKTYPASFNPSIGQYADIHFKLLKSGKLTVVLLDRDGFLTKTLAKDKEVDAGPQHFSWTGRDDNGVVVSDEAWSLKIDFVWAGGKDSYFPANSAVDHITIIPDYYLREFAILAYQLPASSRLHIQAGSAVEDASTKQLKGPVLKTIVNREPRIAGPIVENWSGYDQSGTIYLPDLPNFKIGIAASPLPENSIITTGNHKERFIDQVTKRRKGVSQFSSRVGHPHHHMGLGVLDDVSPGLQIKPLNAVWLQSERSWKTDDSFVEIVGSVEGPSAKSFAKQPGTIQVYVDDDRVLEKTPAGTEFYLRVPIKNKGINPCLISVNWASDYGPTAVNNFKLIVKPVEGSK